MGLFSGITNTLFGKPPTFNAGASLADQAKYNRVNTSNPFGSSVWSQDGDRWTLNTQFSPELQGIWGQAISSAGRPAPTFADFTPGDYGDLASSLEQATYDRGYNLLSPNFQRRDRALEQKLANQGLPIGSEAYADAMTLERQMQDQALENLALSSVGAGRQEAGRLFGQDLSTYGANLEGDLAGFNADQSQYARLVQLLSGLQPAPITPIDVTGPQALQFQGQQNAYNTNLGLFGDLLGAGTRLATAGMF